MTLSEKTIHIVINPGINPEVEAALVGLLSALTEQPSVQLSVTMEAEFVTQQEFKSLLTYPPYHLLGPTVASRAWNFLTKTAIIKYNVPILVICPKCEKRRQDCACRGNKSPNYPWELGVASVVHNWTHIKRIGYPGTGSDTRAYIKGWVDAHAARIKS